MILVLSGPVHGGKTTFLERLLPRWAERGLSCDGFLSIAVTDGHGERGYDLLELKTGRRHPYLRREGGPGMERTGPFFFVPEAIGLARTIIRHADAREILVVDEVGPLELRGEGLWPALREKVIEPERTILLVVREEILEDVAAALGPVVPIVFDIRDPDIGTFVEETERRASRQDRERMKRDYGRVRGWAAAGRPAPELNRSLRIKESR